MERFPLYNSKDGCQQVPLTTIYEAWETVGGSSSNNYSILSEHSQSSLSGWEGGGGDCVGTRSVCYIESSEPRPGEAGFPFPETSGLVSKISEFSYSIKIYFVNLSHPIILQGFHASKILQSLPVLTKSAKLLQNAQEIAFFGLKTSS